MFGGSAKDGIANLFGRKVGHDIELAAVFQ